ncbi:MAG: PQQ-dependent sugar dehydrogenase [Balneolales bacterium]
MKSLALTVLFNLYVCGTLVGQTLPADYYFPLPTEKLELVNSEELAFRVDTVARGLDTPWGLAFLPNGSVLITERAGKLRIVRNGTLQQDSISGMPEVYANGQGGLLDIGLHPEYENNGWIYMTYSNPGEEGAHTAIMRTRLNGNSLIDQEVLFAAEPFTEKRQHFGSRIVFDKDQYLYFSIGDRGEKDNAQDLSEYGGSIIRLHDDGRVPSDNPFVKTSGARPEIYSYGHRNPQGLAVHPETGDIWSHEHGPRGGDEINIIRKGLNYGWPEISFGINYDGSVLTEHTEMEGMESPLHQWTPSIAPSGMDFVWSDRYDGWKGNLFSGALAFQLINRNVIENNQVIHEERMLEGIGRIRNIKMGPDGFLYILEENNGLIIRLLPEELK